MWPKRSLAVITGHRLIIPVLLACLHYAAGFCPGRCICNDEPNLQAACVDNNLEVVPIQLNPLLRVIDLSHNQITSVNYTLSFYMQLQLLNLTQNKIENLGSNNFEYQSELRVLDLSTNSLKQLSRNAFKGLVHLKRLLLNDNQIAEIHPHALPKMSGLVELNLRNNKVTHLAEGTLEQLVNLRVLILENNELLEIPGTGNLNFLPRLVFLNLRKNLIEEVHNESFNGLGALSYLHLGENVLSEVAEEALAPLTNLRWLDMSDNNLTVSAGEMGPSGRGWRWPCIINLRILFVADVADEADIEIDQSDEFIAERQYLHAVTARGVPEFIQSPGTAFGPPGVLDQNRFSVSYTYQYHTDCSVVIVVCVVLLSSS